MAVSSANRTGQPPADDRRRGGRAARRRRVGLPRRRAVGRAGAVDDRRRDGRGAPRAAGRCPGRRAAARGGRRPRAPSRTVTTDDGAARTALLGPGLRRPAGGGPRDRRRRARRARPAARRPPADRQREPHLARRAGRARLDAVEQVRRGLPRPALLRRLPARSTGPRRSASPGPRSSSPATARPEDIHANLQPHSGASANLAAYAALRAARRHRARDVAAARRPPDPRLEGQLLRHLVPRRCPTRVRAGHRAHRLRRGPRPGPASTGRR